MKLAWRIPKMWLLFETEGVPAVLVPVVGREILLRCEHSQVRTCHLTYLTKYRTVEQHKCQGSHQHRRREGGGDNISNISNISNNNRPVCDALCRIFL